MGAHQRRKGRAGELEVQRRLNDIGGDAEILYGQAELGGKDGDIASNYGNFEAKRRAAFPSWLNLGESVRGVYCRRDRGEWLVVVRAYDYEALLDSDRKHRRDVPDSGSSCPDPRQDAGERPTLSTPRLDRGDYRRKTRG